VADPGVGDAGDILRSLSGRDIGSCHRRAAVVPRDLDVQPFIARGGVAVVGPEKSTDLHLAAGRFFLFYPIGSDKDDLAGSEVTFGLIVEVGESAIFGGDGIGPRFFSDDERCSPQFVAGRIDTVLGEDDQRAGAFDHLLGVLDPRFKSVFVADQRGDELGRVDLSAAQLGKMISLAEKTGGRQFLGVVDDPDRDDREGPQVTLYN